ncbi:MAG: transglycosylase SLT domain-containing protein, partial [Nitrospinales bacterium]
MYVGESLPYLQGLSPLSSAASLYEEKVFSQVQLEKEKDQIRLELVRLKNKRISEDKIKNRIRWVISHYKTGLDPRYLDKVPGWIIHESKKYDYDPLFLTAVIITESSFNNWAKSRVGAVGLMQIRPTTGYAL